MVILSLHKVQPLWPTCTFMPGISDINHGGINIGHEISMNTDSRNAASSNYISRANCMQWKLNTKPKN